MTKILSLEARDKLEEEFVDKYGVTGVLQALEAICYDKEAHVSENWQDRALASVWGAAGGAVARFARTKAITALKGVGF